VLGLSGPPAAFAPDRRRRPSRRNSPDARPTTLQDTTARFKTNIVSVSAVATAGD